MSKYMNREQLYKEVWNMPLIKLAPQYNISTEELKKWCDTFLVPLPKVGYWSKVKFGKIVEMPHLPAYAKYRLKVKKLNLHEKSKSIKVEISDNEKSLDIHVKKNLTNPHLITVKTRDGLKRSRTDEYGMKKPWGGGFDLRVSKNNERRALLIIDTLCKWFEKNGCKIHQPFSESITTEVIIGDEAIRIKIEEKSKLTSKTARETWGNYTFYDREYTPTEKLSLVIDNYCWGCSLQRVWSDGKTSKIEEKLGEFVETLFKHAEHEKERKIRKAAEALEVERKRKIQRHKEACKLREKQMLDELINQSDNFNKRKELRAYISEVERLADQQYLNGKYPIELRNWVTWAEGYAEELNPLRQGLPTYKKAIDIMKLEDVD